MTLYMVDAQKSIGQGNQLTENLVGIFLKTIVKIPARFIIFKSSLVFLEEVKVNVMVK
jgi:hypothetical protein